MGVFDINKQDRACSGPRKRTHLYVHSFKTHCKQLAVYISFDTQHTLKRVQTAPYLKPQGCRQEGPAPLGHQSPLWTHCLTPPLFLPSVHCPNPANRQKQRKKMEDLALKGKENNYSNITITEHLDMCCLIIDHG